jgi:hypothetical protein
LTKSRPLEVIERTAEGQQIGPFLAFGKKDTGAVLANLFKDLAGEPDIANMKAWQGESNMAKMPMATLQRLVARRALALLA